MGKTATQSRVLPQVQAARTQALAQVLAAPPFNGNKAALGRKLGYRDGSHIGQMLRGEKALGEGAFRCIEELRHAAGLIVPADPPPTLLSDIARIRELLEKWDRQGMPPARVEG